MLYDHSINGFQGQAGYMPPKGGRTDLSDDEVKSADTLLVYACDLRTGAILTRPDPVTGKQVPWEFLRPGHTCAITSASASARTRSLEPSGSTIRASPLPAWK